MSALDDRMPDVAYANGVVRVLFPSGARMQFPVAGNSRLASGTSAQLSKMKVSRFGIHWPELDEDLSFEGLANGNYGQYVTQDRT